MRVVLVLMHGVAADLGGAHLSYCHLAGGPVDS